MNRAKNDPLIAGRSRAIELLAIQTPSKDVICPILTLLAKMREKKPDRLRDLRETAQKASDLMACSSLSSVPTSAPSLSSSTSHGVGYISE